MTPMMYSTTPTAIITHPITVVYMGSRYPGFRHVMNKPRGREEGQNPRRKDALRRQRLHLPAQPLPLAKSLAHVGEYLRQVAADPSVDPDGHDDPVEVLALHPLSDCLQGLLEREAQRLSRSARFISWPNTPPASLATLSNA